MSCLSSSVRIIQPSSCFTSPNPIRRLLKLSPANLMISSLLRSFDCAQVILLIIPVVFSLVSLSFCTCTSKVMRGDLLQSGTSENLTVEEYMESLSVCQPGENINSSLSLGCHISPHITSAVATWAHEALLIRKGS